MTIEEGGKKVYTCVHCVKEFRGGGINRVKQHLAGKIIRPGPTRFATTFIALNSIHQHQHDLQILVTGVSFVDSRYYRDSKARDFIATILDSRFWNDVGIIIRTVAPLILLLRIVDGDDRSSLAYVYDGMHRENKYIKSIFMHKKSLYKPYTRIIKQLWDKHLRQKLHATAYVLNPAFFYDNENLSRKPEVMAGFLDVLTSQVDANQTDFLSETELYREKVGDFGRLLALKSTKTMRPDKYLYIILLKFWVSTLNSIFNKNRAYDPIDYESIDDIKFWIMEEDTSTTPILDYTEM